MFILNLTYARVLHKICFFLRISLIDYNTDAEGLEKKLTLHNSESWVNMPEVENLLENGYQFDFVTDRIIGDTKVEDSKLVTFDRVAYKTNVVPKVEYIKAETFEYNINFFLCLLLSL